MPGIHSQPPLVITEVEKVIGVVRKKYILKINKNNA
jgi:hypothetical protein